MVRSPPARWCKQPCKPQVTQAVPTQGIFWLCSEAFPSASLGRIDQTLCVICSRISQMFPGRNLKQNTKCFNITYKAGPGPALEVVLCVCLWCCMCLSDPLPVLEIRSGHGELPKAGQLQSKQCSTKIKTIISEEVLILGWIIVSLLFPDLQAYMCSRRGQFSKAKAQFLLAKGIKVSCSHLYIFTSHMPKWNPTKHMLRTILIPSDIHTKGSGLGPWACPLLSLQKTKGMLRCCHGRISDSWQKWWRAVKFLVKDDDSGRRTLVGYPVLGEKCDSQMENKVVCECGCPNKLMAGVLNIRPTASVSLALV